MNSAISSLSRCSQANYPPPSPTPFQSSSTSKSRSLPQSQGSLVHPALPWSVVDHLSFSSCTSALHLYGCDRLHLSSGSSYILGHTASVTWVVCFSLVLPVILCVTLALRQRVSTLGSSSTGFVSFGRLRGVASSISTIAPPSSDSSMGRRHAQTHHPYPHHFLWGQCFLTIQFALSSVASAVRNIIKRIPHTLKLKKIVTFI